MYVFVSFALVPKELSHFCYNFEMVKYKNAQDALIVDARNKQMLIAKYL